MISNSYTIAQTAVKIYETTNATQRIYVRSTGADMFLGGSNVTTANGIQLTKDTLTEIYVDEFESLYAITSTGTHSIQVLGPSNS